MFKRKRGYRFSFVNYGGSFQLRIVNAETLRHLDELEAPFWMATSAPVAHFRCDPKLLERLDRDGNGRLLSREIRAACKWIFAVLKDESAIDLKKDVLVLDHLDMDHADGSRLFKSALRILTNLGQSDATQISLSQIRDRYSVYSAGRHNGDGVIAPDHVDDPDLKAFVTDVMAAMGAVEGADEQPGIDIDKLNGFINDAKAFLEWQKKSTEDVNTADLFPLADGTASGYEQLEALTGKIDDFFSLGRATAFNQRLGRQAAPPASAFETFENLETRDAYLAAAPLAPVDHNGSHLTIDENLNPHYDSAMRSLNDSVLKPLLGDNYDGLNLAPAQWQTVRTAFAPYAQWLAAKQGGTVETLGAEKLSSYVEGSMPDTLTEIMEGDLAAAPELEALGDLEYLIMLQRWILDICNNFISFADLYDPELRAMIEEGHVVMDGMIFNFNMKVDDAAKHSAVAKRSGMYLFYSEVTGAKPEDTFQMITPITSCQVGSIGIDKRGVLFDRDGKQWDIRITRVIENPTSIRQAIFAPIKRLISLITSATERITSGTQKQLEGRLSKSTTSMEKSIQQSVTTPVPVAPVAAPPAGNKARDMVMSGGIVVASLGALGSSFAYISKSWQDMNKNLILVAIVVILAVIIIPTIISAWVKLRRRNLNAILEASGWAINSRMRLTRTLARVFTHRPPHPKSFDWLNVDLNANWIKALRKPKDAGDAGKEEGS